MAGNQSAEEGSEQMTVDALIKRTLSPLGCDISNGTYRGDAPEYITFGYTAIGDDFGDDAPNHERYLVHIELHTPIAFNVNKLIRRAKAALLQAGFTWPSSTTSTDGESRMTLLECEIVTGVDADGNI